MRTNIKDKFNTTFGSWFEFVDHIETLKWWPGGSNNDWAGGTRNDAFTLARDGWRSQTPQVSALARKVADRTVSSSAKCSTTEIVFEVTGAAYDPGAYMSGVPECWVAFKESEEKRAVRIVVDGTLSASVSKETKIKMGTAIAALVMALDSAGHPVNVDLFFGGREGRRRKKSCFIRLHSSNVGSVLDVDRLVYGIAHPLPMRGMAHTLWGEGTTPYSRNDKPEKTCGDFDLWLGGGLISDVAAWKDDGESWVTDQYLAQTKDQ